MSSQERFPGVGGPAALPPRQRYERAEAVFVDLCKAERAGATLAEEDLRRLRRLVDPRRRTYMAMGCTALIARLVDPTLHPASLQVQWQPTWQPLGAVLRAHNGRDLCTRGLVKGAMRQEVSLGIYQREPLQNKPFTQEKSVYDALGLQDTWTEAGHCLMGLVEEAASASPERLRQLVLAYIKIARVVWEQDHRDIPLGAMRLDYYKLREVCATIVEDRSERGKWGQAFVAAALQVAGMAARSGRSVHASRNLLGDVQVRVGDTIVRAYEVRQKERLDSDPHVFAHEAGQQGVRQVVYVDLVPGAGRIPDTELQQIYEATRVVLLSIAGPKDFLDHAIATATLQLDDFVERFPEVMLRWLTRMGVTEEGRKTWVAHFQNR